MDRPQTLLVVRAAAVVLVLAAIGAQAAELAGHGAFNPTRFFAYFTIQSNLLGVAAFVLLLVHRNRPRSRPVELLRGAATVYLLVTFFVVIFLLSGIDVGLQLGWVDFVLHKLFPIVILLDWVLDPPSDRLHPRDALVWLAYPLVWTGLTIVRGAGDGWYPYPFLDPANGGYGQVFVTAVAIAIGFFVLSLGVIALGNARFGSERMARASAPP